MIAATKLDIDRIVEILVASFDKNKSTNFVIKQDPKREERLKRLIEYSFFMGMNFGEVFLSDNKESCAIVLYPHKKKTTIKSILWDLKLVTGAIGFKNVFKVMKREALLKEKYPKEPFAHLWYIGVEPENQGKGKGTALMSSILEYIELPIYLETSNERNLPFYKKLGFQIIDTLDEIGYKLYILKK